AKTAVTDGMIYIPDGTFLMGTDDAEGFASDGEGPVHEVRLDAYYIDKYAVTNAQFRDFVEATSYVTEAEKFGWSYVFHLFVPADLAAKAQRPFQTPWWLAIEGADWSHPEGPDSGIEDRLDHPVIHVSWND